LKGKFAFLDKNGFIQGRIKFVGAENGIIGELQKFDRLDGFARQFLYRQLYLIAFGKNIHELAFAIEFEGLVGDGDGLESLAGGGLGKE